MGTRWKKYSHSIFTKIIVFIIAILFFTGAMTTFLDAIVIHQGDYAVAFEKSYYQSREYMNQSDEITHNLTLLINEYKNEENILNGGTINENQFKWKNDSLLDSLFADFQENSRSYNPNLSEEENYEKFKEVYADQISQMRNELIEEDLKTYKAILHRLNEFQGIIYYASDGENVYTNSPSITVDHINTFPSYIIVNPSESIVYPEEVKENRNYYWIEQGMNEYQQQDRTMYIAFTKTYLDTKIKEWQEKKAFMTNNLYKLTGFSLGFLLAFIYLLFVIGKKSFDDKEIHLNFIDRLYNELKLAISFILIVMWFLAIEFLFNNKLYEAIFPVTLFIGALGLIMVLSLIKQMKYRTLIKHTLLYRLFYKIFIFLKEIYDSGSIGFKVVLAVIGYPIIVALTYILSPITIGLGVWLAMKKVKEYKGIQEGIKKVKEGNYHHHIHVAGKGELANLAADINSITDGLKKAVANELKSERLKTELITNVSHDIRTPLTSIITYVDLLKKEEDQSKATEYIEIIDQKAQRLKILTEDLFEASKASSGNMPVSLEQIELISLITQGLGELDDKVNETNLEFKINHPKEKIWIQADGKLLWRAIENLLSNIFKYALQGSRVYIDIENLEDQAIMVIKNISAYELNISADELMERFTRGDESRSSQGSGLGLSIAKSLIELQRGYFQIEIDGDLFKAIIKMPK